MNSHPVISFHPISVGSIPVSGTEIQHSCLIMIPIFFSNHLNDREKHKCWVFCATLTQLYSLTKISVMILYHQTIIFKEINHSVKI